MSDSPLNMVFIPTRKPVRQLSTSLPSKGQRRPCRRTRRSFFLSLYACMASFVLCLEGMSKGLLCPLLEKIARPKSKGELKLTTLNVDENPSVSFNYFNHPEDLRGCVDGIRMIEKVVKSKHFTNFTQCNKETIESILNMSVQANVNLIPKHTNDTHYLEQFCKDTVVTIWHYHGGCQVDRVVDRRYRVLGVDSLRVIDGSTFIESPGTNPQATVLMLGRYMGVKLLRERLGRKAGV